MTAPFDPFASGGRSGPSADPGPVGASAAARPAGDSSGQAVMSVAGPPLPLAVAACVIGLVGLLVGIAGWANWVAIVGWVLSGPIAIGTLAAFVLVDTKRRSAPVYASPGWARPAYGAAMAISIAGIIVGALGFALWVGRL